MKRELERLADIVIYGNAETIEREFTKVEQLGGSLAILAQAVEMSRYIGPLCECGADYYEWLEHTHQEYKQAINKESEGATVCNCSQLDDDLAADGWTCYACHATNRDKSRQGTNAKRK